MEFGYGRSTHFSSDPGANIRGAKVYGPPLEYKVRVPAFVGSARQFPWCRSGSQNSLLKKWHHFSNEKKNEIGIAKNAGVSIVRAGQKSTTAGTLWAQNVKRTTMIGGDPKSSFLLNWMNSLVLPTASRKSIPLHSSPQFLHRK